MTLAAVCDSSAIIALLLDRGPDGQWVVESIARARLLTPSLVMFEAGDVIRRQESG